MIIIDGIEFTEEESNFIKQALEDSFKFWSTSKDVIGEFPWELFEGNVLNLHKSAIEKLKQANINTFEL